MELAAELPVTLVVKAANQRVADQTVECVQGWTVRKLKQHLETVYPSNPKHHQQKLIYSGRLLADHLTLKEVLRQYGNEQSHHTVHLVCSPSVENANMPGAFNTTTEQKIEPASNSSHTSLSSNDSESTLRHRGTRISDFSASPSIGATNSGTSPIVPYPGGAASLPGYLGMSGLAGTPMMGTPAPGVAVPGYPYTPEQMAWMQQMYSQYMAQYMQYYGYQMPPYAPAVAEVNDPRVTVPLQVPPPQQAGNPALPNNQNPANQNMRMNAQGGLEEDEDEEQRDWLDYIYVFFRFMVLLSIIYFYSSLQRFAAVALIGVAFYIIQQGWMHIHRQQQVLEQRQQLQQQQQEQQQQQQQQSEQSVTAQQNSEAQEGGTAESAATSTQPQVPPPPPPPSPASILLHMLLTFFTSLIPSQPPAVNRN